MKETKRVRVIYRRWRGKNGSAIALFPYLPGDGTPSTCLSYEHVGQHATACYPLVIRATRPASFTEKDVEDLDVELARVGYGCNLKIIARADHSKIGSGDEDAEM